MFGISRFILSRCKLACYKIHFQFQQANFWKISSRYFAKVVCFNSFTIINSDYCDRLGSLWNSF